MACCAVAMAALLDPLAPPWTPRPPPGARYVAAQPWVAPLEAAEKRLLLACLHNPLIIREPALLEAISKLLPRAHEPLKFTAFPAQLRVSSDGTRVSKHPSDRWGKYRTAVCTSAPMTSGVHYAEFRIIEKAGWIRVGVVNAELQHEHPPVVDDERSRPRSSAVDDGWTRRYGSRASGAFDASGGGSATSGAMGWGYNAALGSCWHNSGFVDWVGQRVAETGDVVGLLLDVDHGCLDVFLDGERLGRMVDHSVSLASAAIVTQSPGGEESSALCWMVELHDAADQVEIVGKQPPQLG